MTNWNLYETRMNIDGLTERDVQINTIKNSVLDDFANSPSYFLALRNGIEQGFNILEESLIVKNPNKKRAICKPDETIIVGDIIAFDNSDWICTENDTTSEIYDIGIISRCNNTLLFYPQSNESSDSLVEIPCIVGKGNLSIDTNKYISLPADEYVITCPNNSSSKQITENTRFILSKSAYKVLGIDDISMLGLLNIRVKQDAINEDDNLELGIANYYSHQHVYSVDIQNSDATLYINDTLALNVIATDNGQQVLSPALSYSSSNESVANVVDGQITCLAVGTAIITVVYNGVSDSITLTVQEEVIADNYTVSIDKSTTTVKLNNSITLSASVFNNGIIDSTKSVVWNVSNRDGTSNLYVSIVSQEGSSITLKATSNNSYVNKYVVIKASKSDDLSVYDEHVVQIKSIF